MLRLVCLSLAVLTCAVVAARAADTDLPALGKAGDFTLAAPEVDEEDAAAGGWYLRTSGGRWRAQGRVSGIPRTGTPDVTTGYVFGGGVGYRFLPWLRGEVTVDYAAPVSSSSRMGVAEISATTALANVYWDMFTFANVTPYVGAGLGFGQVNFSFTPHFSPEQWDQSQMQFVWNVSAGIGWAITPTWTLDLGYRYAAFGSPTFALGALPVTLENVATHQLRIGVRYSFQ